MPKFPKILILLVLSLSSACDLSLRAAEKPAASGHRIIKAGCNSKSVAIVDAGGRIEWEYPIESETSDAWLLPSGNIIFSFKHGVREVSYAKETVWEYRAPAKAEVHSCQPLANGLFLVSETHQDLGFLYEMDAKGVKHRTLRIEAKAGPHGQFRQTRKTPQGSYLVTYMSGRTLELDAEGRELRRFPLGSYVAVRLPDGNTLVAGGDAHCAVEYDTQGREVWRVDRYDLPGNELGFVAGLQRLPNGNTVLTNWPGHGGKKDQPQIVEITRDKRVVWELKDPRLNLISSVTVLDLPGQPSALELLR
jgi:hypothetical protein